MCASKSNTVIMQRLKKTTGYTDAPCYVAKRTLYSDFKTPYVSGVIQEGALHTPQV